jgi:hypothetical protein
MSKGRVVGWGETLDPADLFQFKAKLAGFPDVDTDIYSGAYLIQNIYDKDGIVLVPEKSTWEFVIVLRYVEGDGEPFVEMKFMRGGLCKVTASFKPVTVKGWTAHDRR